MKNKSLLLFVFLSLTFIFVIIGITLYFGYDPKNLDRGTFGDMFGAANALFTGLSFVGLIVTILLQQKDIQEQRNENNLQSFENTFFNLLNIHREIVCNLHKRRTKKTSMGMQKVETDNSLHGIEVFSFIYVQYGEQLSGDLTFNNDAFLKTYKENWEILGHYTRHFITILLTVERLNNDNICSKYRYIDILKSQLGEYETAVLFYFFLSSKGSEYKYLANKYNLFEFINIELVTDDIKFYEVKNQNTHP